MKQENKELLKDLCSRLPYNVAIDCRDEDSWFTCYLTTDILNEIQNNTYHWEYKPYLFPISTLTEEQRREISKLIIDVDTNYPPYGKINTEGCDNLFICVTKESVVFMDYCFTHHLDVNGLIEKGLAIDATGKNIY